MSSETLCEQLLLSEDTASRGRLLHAQAADANCLSLLLERAGATASVPQDALHRTEVGLEVAAYYESDTTAAALWRIRAQAFRLLGRHADALAAFEEAARSARRAGDDRLAARVQIGSIDTLGMLGRYDEAVVRADTLTAQMRATGDEQDAAKVLFNAGSLHFRRDHYARSLECYEQAGEILERSGDSTIVARVQTNCANALTQLNRIDEAVTFYNLAHATFAEQEMTAEAAVVDMNLGYLHFVSGRYGLAVDTLERARREFTELNRDHEAARSDIDLAEAYRALNLLPEAVVCNERALETFARLPLDYDCARAEMGRAAALMSLNRHAEAEAGLERAENVFRTQKNSLQRAHVRLIRAYLLREQGGSSQRSLREAGAAARVMQHGGLVGWAAEARFVVAEAALEAEQKTEQKSDQKSEQDAVPKIGQKPSQKGSRQMHAVARTARKYGRGWLECRAERALGLYYARRFDYPRALRHFFAGVAALEDARTLIPPEEMHVAFLRDKLAIYEDLVETLLARGTRRDIETALETIERSKSRLLLERLQAASRNDAEGDEVTEESRERVASLREALSRAYYRTHAFGEDDPRRKIGGSRDLEALIPLENEYRIALRGSNPRERVDAETMTQFESVPTTEASALCASLTPGETLIEFYVVRGKVCVFVLTPAGVQIQEEIADWEDVTCVARRLRCHLQRPEMPAEYAAIFRTQHHAGVREVLRKLYDLLLRPLESLLDAAQTTKVVPIPHGLMHGLPFHAFFDGEQYALDRWEFLYAPSAAVWLMGAHRTTRPSEPDLKHQNILIMGVPAPGIERVAEEVAQLADFLETETVFCAEAATMEMFRAKAPDSQIIHLASHALFRSDNPLFSGLRMANGWLLARDLYDMRLDCDLATLSACHTGASVVEPGDELFGMIRGFLAAGCRSVAASLWSADDEATAYLMVQFYTLLAAGSSYAAALRGAQQRTRSLYPHPYFWAAFALTGRRGSQRFSTENEEEQ